MTQHPTLSTTSDRTLATSSPSAGTPSRGHRTALAGLALAAGLLGATLVAGCGDDGAGASTSGTAEVTTTHAAHHPVVVTATDYAFAGLPGTVPAGTPLQLVNDSSVELHELVAIRLPDSETRPVAELLKDDPAALSAQPATVLLAPPGAQTIVAVGDGTLTEPGRYALICAIPTGISPQAYLDAVKAAGGGKPELDTTAPPHLAHGMFAELVVE